ncbi:hypothetical protein WMF45_35480 [Sorangium sp. So ce448]|uniref:hypothetical protein n=1 Tax=Sorangium sp. So ce448 TaxID=3133314 RepID=UPI003F620EB5
MYTSPLQFCTRPCDDLQWADPASLNLLKVILSNTGGAHLLLIDAARDQEVDEGYPLSFALSDIRSAGATVSELPLATRST